MTETRRRGEGNKPKADAPKLAPDPNNVFERMFVRLSASHPDSDLEYFAGGRPKSNGSGNCVGMFEKHGVPYRWVDSSDGEKAVIAAIRHKLIDKHGWALVQREASGHRGVRPRHITTMRYLSYVDLQDWQRAKECARKFEALQVFLQPHKGKDKAMDDGGLYIIWDEQEEKCWYVGQTRGNIPDRVVKHFQRPGQEISLEFDNFCVEKHPHWSSWKVYLLPSQYCDPFVRKSLFWDREDYEKHWPHTEENYQQWISRHEGWNLDQAETALITMLKPQFNVKKNIHYKKGREENEYSISSFNGDD